MSRKICLRPIYQKEWEGEYLFGEIWNDENKSERKEAYNSDIMCNLRNPLHIVYIGADYIAIKHGTWNLRSSTIIFRYRKKNASFCI